MLYENFIAGQRNLDVYKDNGSIFVWINKFCFLRVPYFHASKEGKGHGGKGELPLQIWISQIEIQILLKNKLSHWLLFLLINICPIMALLLGVFCVFSLHKHFKGILNICLVHDVLKWCFLYPICERCMFFCFVLFCFGQCEVLVACKLNQFLPLSNSIKSFFIFFFFFDMSLLYFLCLLFFASCCFCFLLSLLFFFFFLTFFRGLPWKLQYPVINYIIICAN